MPIIPLTPALQDFRTIGDISWQRGAACRDTDTPDQWYPDPSETDRITRAKAICRWCPVRAECLDAALETGDRDGIRGGLTEDERRKLHNERTRRLDPDRVAATLAGRRIHLTVREQRAVALEGNTIGLSRDRLALLLDVEPDRVPRLIRAGRADRRTAQAAIPRSEAA